MRASGILVLRCETCLEQLTYSGHSLELENAHVDSARKGQTTILRGVSEYYCPHCENHIMVRHEFTKESKGAYKDPKTQVFGAELVSDFDPVPYDPGDKIYSLDHVFGLETIVTNEPLVSFESGVLLLIEEINRMPELIYKIKAREFEELVACVFRLKGFEVELTKQTRDGGRDIIALRNDLGIPTKYIVECKRWANDNPVSVEIARALYGVQMQEGTNKSVIATTSYFSADTKKFASTLNTTRWMMSLKDYKDVMGWLSDAV